MKEDKIIKPNKNSDPKQMKLSWREAAVIEALRMCNPYDKLTVAINSNDRIWSVHIDKAEKIVLEVQNVI